MKVILSRKGFDSKFGGIPSPIFPDGSMVSFPIPSTEGIPAERCRAGRFALEDLLVNLSYKKLSGTTSVHLDPDLEAGSIERAPGWMPSFGQVGAAQSHLNNQGVGEGDLFLFFGWYRRVESTITGWKYVRRESGMHSLFGWLQVDKVLTVDTLSEDEVPNWLKDHPHIAYRKYFANQCNTIYVAKELLSLGGKNTQVSGAGVFKHWSPELQLTAQGQTRSIWELPTWFEPNASRPALTYHTKADRWTRTDGGLQLRSVAIGQEFVLDSIHYPEAVEWARTSIEKHR